MREDAISSIICNNDECRDRVKPLISFFINIEKSLKTFEKPTLVSNSKPLIENIVVPSKTMKRLEEYPDEIKRYILARLLSLYYSKEQGYIHGECPICGYTPKVVILKRREGNLYSGYEPRLRCLCGYETDWNEWRCPSCGGEGRDLFDTYILNNAILIRRCKICGFKSYSIENPMERYVQIYVILLNSLDEKVSLTDATEK